MDYDQQEMYEMTPPPQTRPWLWIGLTTFFAVCCACFALIALGEAALIFSGNVALSSTDGSSTPTSSAKPTLGTVRFCVEQPDSNTQCSPTVSTVPTTTKTIYATFDYKGMARGSTYAYEWELDGDIISSKEKLRWPRDSSGIAQIKLEIQKAGEYRLIITVGDDEKTGTLKVR